MKRHFSLAALLTASLLGGCAADGSFDTSKALVVGAGVVQAVTLDENSVKQTASWRPNSWTARTRWRMPAMPTASV